METEEDRIYNETAANLMQEVSLPPSSVTEPQFQAAEIPVSLPASVAIPEPTSSYSLPENADAEMQKRLDAVRSGFKTVEVEALGHQKPYPGALVSMPASGSNVFTFGQNQAKDQANAVNTSRPLSPTPVIVSAEALSGFHIGKPIIPNQGPSEMTGVQAILQRIN